MIWAATRIRIGGKVMRHADMSHFGVQEAMDHLTIHNRAASDARTNREVNKIRDPSTRAPSGLASGRGVYIGVESDWDLKRAPYGPGQIVLLPSGFRGRSDVSEGRRVGTKVNRPERSDADSAQLGTSAIPKKSNNLFKRQVG